MNKSKIKKKIKTSKQTVQKKLKFKKIFKKIIKEKSLSKKNFLAGKMGNTHKLSAGTSLMVPAGKS